MLGGYVFRLSTDGKHGLVVETSDQSVSSTWFLAQDVISDTTNHSFNGKKFMDWRLPTKIEMQEMYDQRIAIGGFNLNSRYWTEIRFDNTQYWIKNFQNGFNGYDPYSYLYFIRAVRAF